jgi:hypothetical protein
MPVSHPLNKLNDACDPDRGDLVGINGPADVGRPSPSHTL